MCGIVGYAGRQQALPILLTGLRRLEYRGYDSAGVAVLDGGEVQVVRKAGKLNALEEVLGSDTALEGATGIGHTRWATHGQPTDRNAHPHLDCTGKVAVIHNGIIENFFSLRAQLEADGHRFASQTDTECVAHLVEGRASGENFVASDFAAFLDHTKDGVILEDDQVVVVTPERLDVTDLDGNPVEAYEHHVDWDLSAAEKGGYEHFMLKEMHGQPLAIKQTLEGRTDLGGRLVLDELRMSEDELREVDKVFVVACGTAYHAGMVAKYAIEHWTRLPVEIEIASEFRYRDPVLDRNTLVIAISQSGETADTLGAVRYARQQGSNILAVTNTVGSSLTREADGVIYMHAGPEIGVAATKTFATQMVSQYILAMYLAQVRGSMFPEEIAEVLTRMGELPRKVEQAIGLDAQIRELAERFHGAHDWLYVGRHTGYPAALEGALKLKEISYVHAEGYPAGELKHGPIALVEEGVPVVAVATECHVYPKMLSNIQEVRARGAEVIAVATEGDDRIGDLANDVLLVPRVHELLAPVVVTPPLQFLAYHVAKLRGCDVDQPRNLAKSVTVE